MKHILRVAALFLSLCLMLGSLTSCMAFFRIVDMVDSTMPEPSETTGVNPDSGEKEPDIASSYLKYTLTEQAERDFAEQLALCCRLTLEEGTDAPAIEAAWEELEKQYYHIATQSQIAYILYCTDQSDETLSENYLYSSELSGSVYGDYMELCLAIYESQSPYRDTFFSDWTEDEIAEMRSYSDELETYRMTNDELLVEFRDLNDSEFFEKAPALYLQTVKNLNTIAKLQGYEENYYTYAYDKVYLRDFGDAELEQLRQYTATYLIPLQKQLMQAFSAGFERLSMREQLLISNMIEKDYDALSKDYVELYLNSLPSEMQSLMTQMLDPENSFFTDSKDAYAGAFTGTLYEHERAFCYFGPGYQSAGTVIHELGHYYAGHYVGNDSLPIDLAEVHSQGNEMLFLAFMQQHMDADVFEVYVDYQMYYSLTGIILCVVIDEFESNVYRVANSVTNPGDQLDAIMDSVLTRYGGAAYFAENIADVYNYWRAVTIESPVYYISYAVSGIVSVELYAIGAHTPQNATAVYEELVSGFSSEERFSQALTRAGLRAPFTEDVFLNIQTVLTGGN